MQISYFEFLITSEFSLGIKIPRINVWSTNIVKSYIALNSQPYSNVTFGRLVVGNHVPHTIQASIFLSLSLHAY